MSRSAVFVLLLLTLTQAQSAAAEPRQDALRAVFLTNLEAAERGAITIPGDSAELRAYMLYPYLQAARLLGELRREEQSPDQAIATFLDTHGDAVWTRELRRAWLERLGERQQWPYLLAYYLESRADVALRCRRFEGMIATNAAAGLRESVLEVWRTGSELPASCTQPFDWLKNQGALTADEIALRTRLALENGKPAVAKMLLPQLPPERAAPLKFWLDVLEFPHRNLEAAVRGNADPAIVFAGFSKLVRQSTDSASDLLPRLEAACGKPCALRSPATIAELRREIALNLAWSRKPETLSAFRAVEDSALDERAHEWRVRAALWAGQWPLAGQWLAAFPAELAAQPRWRYWRARVLQANAQADSARALYGGLAQENGWYSLLAAERLGRGHTPVAAQYPADAALRARIAAHPAVQRAGELYRIRRNPLALAEWSEGTSGLDFPALIEAARLAHSWEWYLLTVGTASRAQVFDDFALLYPRPFAQEVKEGVRVSGMPAEWIYAVMRQESLYDPRARSSANAMGLLQLLPDTARAVARRWSRPQPQGEDLFQPAINVPLGAAYLREQWDRFDERFILVLGAYNAGPNALRRWLPEASIDADVWIENVPYNETRNYIQKVVWHSSVFGWEQSGEPQRATRYLQAVTPLPVAAAAPGE